MNQSPRCPSDVIRTLLAPTSWGATNPGVSMADKLGTVLRAQKLAMDSEPVLAAIFFAALETEVDFQYNAKDTAISGLDDLHRDLFAGALFLGTFDQRQFLRTSSVNRIVEEVSQIAGLERAFKMIAEPSSVVRLCGIDAMLQGIEVLSESDYRMALRLAVPLLLDDDSGIASRAGTLLLYERRQFPRVDESTADRHFLLDVGGRR